MHITIVGGGTAGWITALMARRNLPRTAKISLVESAEIGIIGAGEGTTPHFVGLFLDAVGISMADLVQHAGATFKNAIRFENWTGDGSFYMHPFDDHVTPGLDIPMVHPQHPLPNREVSFSCHASCMNRVLIRPSAEGPTGSGGPLDGLQSVGGWAVHFNAKKLAAYLKTIALQRGIEHIEGKVVGLRARPSGLLAQLVLEDGRAVEGDFFFDCTGMRRLLVGGHYKVPLVDVSSALPVNRAIPFSLPLNGPRAPYTEAIAMDAGWAWKIPVQGRYGCGYVYEEAFATEDEARAHVRARFGEVEMPRVLSFEAGYLERIWEGNVCAVGLASGFLEPLEATSIWATVITLDELFSVHLPVGDSVARDEMNAFHRRLNERIVDFLHLHYLGGRTDTPFWATFRERTTPPPTSASILERGGYRWPLVEDALNAVHPAPFPSISWLWVAKGLGLLERKSHERYWQYYGFEKQYDERLSALRKKLRRASRACVPHEDMLRAMGG